MTLSDISAKARALCNVNSTDYTDANLLIDINIWLVKVGDMIFGSQDNSDFDDARATDYPVQTTPMVANQRDYPIAVTERLMKLKRVDVCYDGTNAYKAESFDTGTFTGGIKFNNSSSVDATFDGNFVQQNPRYDFSYGAVWISPMPVAADVTNGGFIRTEWERSITPFTSAELTAGTAIPGFDPPFHPILAYGAAKEFATARQLPQLEEIQPELDKYEQRIRAAYGRKDLDMRLNLQADYVNYR